LPSLSGRNEISLVGSLFLGGFLLFAFPFPANHWLLSELLVVKPWLFYGAAGLYHVLLFSTPYIALSLILTAVYIFGPTPAKRAAQTTMPPLPDGKDFSLVIGEVHDNHSAEPVDNPHWLTIPERGLYTGIAVFGAIGSGKTSCCMYPFAKQILSSTWKGSKVGGLVLEVKGDFCHKIKQILEDCGRGEDYVELNLSDSRYRYNPLRSNLDAYAMAYSVASLLTSLFGKGREPFWQQAYTNKSRLELMESALASTRVAVVDPVIYLEIEGLSRFRWEKNSKTNQMESLLTDELAKFLLEHSVLHQVCEVESLPSGVKPIRDADRRAECEAVKRWFEQDWSRIDQRLRTSIVEGISFFLSLFDDNPTLRRVFCPPKECFEPGADGSLGIPLAPFAELIEQGKVVALNFPMSTSPGLSRMIGTLMKMDFQRAVLDRVQRMESNPNEQYPPALFLCDEYHAFVTAGANEPTGDEKFFSQARQSRCIPIVATQSISSLRSALTGETWRTLLQTFRTKIFLSLSDDFSAQVASDLCGRDEHLKVSYNFSESGQDAAVSMWNGRSVAEKSSITASKTYSVQKDVIFEPRIFSELRNAQSIVLGYDGLNPIPATFCFLKPYYLSATESYFDQVRRGQL
jgi:hypothetical protein